MDQRFCSLDRKLAVWTQIHTKVRSTTRRLRITPKPEPLLACGPLTHHQVDQTAGDVDALPELAALYVRPYPLAGERYLFSLFLRDICGDLYAVTQLAVYLDHERDLLGRYEALVPGGPFLQVDGVLLPHLCPHLLGVVRGERREDGDEGPQG